MHFKLISFQVLNGAFVWAFHGEEFAKWVMLLSDYIALVVVTTMLAHVWSLATIASNVLLHCRATNALTTAKGANEEDKIGFPLKK